MIKIIHWRLAGLMLTLAPAVALAQTKTYLGTKPDPITGVPTASSPTIMPVIQVVLVAGILVFAMKSLAPKLISKMNRRLVTSAGSGIHIEESATFAGGTLYVVRAREKALLLSVGANGVQCLSDLTPLTAEPKLPVFMDMVDDSMSERGDSSEPPRSFDEVETEPVAVVPSDPTSLALDRLQRFIG